MSLARDVTSVTDGGCVGLVRGGALGDFVLTLPLIDALRNVVPSARLVLVGEPSTTRLAGAADRVAAEGGDWARMFTPDGPSQALTRRFADCHLLVACLPGGPESAPSHYLRNLRSLCNQVLIGDPRPKSGQTYHMTQRLLEPLRGADDLTVEPRPVIPLPSHPRSEASGLVILHPGSGGRSKCWPAERFLNVLQWLQQQAVPTGILWGPAEQARREEFPPELVSSARLLSPGSAWQLAQQLAGARLYIGNDSGPGHVAAAVNCPTLSLFGPTEARLWHPVGARVLQAPDGDMENLASSTVIDAVTDMLSA